MYRETAVGKKIKAIRESKGFNQSELAARAGVTPSCINSIERGSRNPSYKSLIGIANALETTVDNLMN